MARPNPRGGQRDDLTNLGGTTITEWSRTPGGLIAGRAYLDGADETAATMEAKWGCDRLRLLVPPEWREKFDRQRYLLNQAIWHGQLEDIRREANRMVTAWLKLDALATAAGCQPLSPEQWETVLADGTVAVLVPDDVQAHRVLTEGRAVAVYTLEEIGRFLSNYGEVARAKLVVPGAVVTAVRRTVDDPLTALRDSDEALNDPLADIAAG